jgi:hypothetical protein
MNIKEFVLNEQREGRIVFRTIDGLMSANLDDFIKQPIDGILYDLNRDEVTVMSFIDDPKWVNDYAVAMTIRKLKQRIEELEHQILSIKRIKNE